MPNAMPKPVIWNVTVRGVPERAPLTGVILMDMEPNTEHSVSLFGTGVPQSATGPDVIIFGTLFKIDHSGELVLGHYLSHEKTTQPKTAARCPWSNLWSCSWAEV
jgi:hypothetical protein